MSFVFSRSQTNHPRRPSRILILIILFLCGGGALDSSFAAAPTSASEPLPKRVLVIYSDERLLPANVVVDDAIRRTFATDTTHRVELLSEFLDISRFGSEAHERRRAEFFRQKYADWSPDLILVHGQAGVAFLLSIEQACFHRCRSFFSV